VAPDWIVHRIKDHGPGTYYRYSIEGTNLNYEEGHASRRFSWSVPGLDDARYDLSSAVLA
jgi:hypothetical protein